MTHSLGLKSPRDGHRCLDFSQKLNAVSSSKFPAPRSYYYPCVLNAYSSVSILNRHVACCCINILLFTLKHETAPWLRVNSFLNHLHLCHSVHDCFFRPVDSLVNHVLFYMATSLEFPRQDDTHTECSDGTPIKHPWWSQLCFMRLWWGRHKCSGASTNMGMSTLWIILSDYELQHYNQKYPWILKSKYVHIHMCACIHAYTCARLFREWRRDCS